MDLEQLSSVAANYENIIVEVAGEEEVKTENVEEEGETVTIEVTVVDNDGNAEYIVTPSQSQKRPFEGTIQIDEPPPAPPPAKKMAVRIPNKEPIKQYKPKEYHRNTGNFNVIKRPEKDVIISIKPDKVVDVSEGESAKSQTFKCFLCGDKKKFSMWADLLAHFNDNHCLTEGLTTTCQCPLCGTMLTLQQQGGIDDFDNLVLNALSHMVRAHDYSDDNVTTMTRKIDKDCAEKISCEHCGATVRADYMKKHLAHYCKGCRNMFDCKCGRRILPTNLPSHANVCAFLRTEKACTCPECGLIFKTVHNMELHFRRCHLKESRFACDLCDEKFFKRDVLVQHTYISHGLNVDGRTVLYCTVDGCDFTAIYPYHLNQHYKRNHEKGPFVCDRCDKVCNTYYTLNRHQCVFRQLRGRGVTSHLAPPEKKAPVNPKLANVQNAAAAGLRIFKCSECNFTNASRKRVELHGRVHREGILEEAAAVSQIQHQQQHQQKVTAEQIIEAAQEIQEILYCCGDCGFTSGDESVLREHLETHNVAQQQEEEEVTEQVLEHVADQTEVQIDSMGNIISFGATSVPHQDAEAISLLNHFKMGNSDMGGVEVAVTEMGGAVNAAVLSGADMGTVVTSSAEMGTIVTSGAEIGAVVTSSAEIGGVEMTTAEMGGVEMVKTEVGGVEMGTTEIGGVEMGTTEIGGVEIATTEIGSAVISGAEMGTAMGTTEIVTEATVIEDFDPSNVVLQIPETAETVPLPAETNLYQEVTSDFSGIAAVALEGAQAVIDASQLQFQIHDDPSILPKKSTTLAKNSPRLFHELTKSGAQLIHGAKQTIVRPADSLQEYNIVFQSNDDHPTPPGQIILLSPEDAEQLMVQQQAELQTN